MVNPRVQPPALAIRILHGSLLTGASLACAVLAFIRHQTQPWLDPAILAGGIPAVLAVGLLVVALTVVRSQIVPRAYPQTADVYWSGPQTRGRVVLFWAMIDGAILLSLVAYFLTGGRDPAVTGVLGLLVLAWGRPAVLEGDEAATTP